MGEATLELNTKQSEWTLPELVDHIRGLSSGNRGGLSQVCMLIKLILVMPATNAVSECSFSAMKRIKNNDPAATQPPYDPVTCTQR